MAERINSVPRLAEPLEGYNECEGDFLGGVMANHEFIQARESQSAMPASAEETGAEIIIAHQSAQSLHRMGADNIRGVRTLAQERNPGKDNLRGKT